MTEERKKVSFVENVFNKVNDKYDLMNDLMSFGIHRFWKRFALMHTGLEEGMKALDVASGTGDLGALLQDQVGESGTVILTDINASMLHQGRSKLLDQGKLKNMQLLQANAENLPFEDNIFDCVTIAFGLRNITDKNAALSSMYRVIKPGGRLLILEFSKANELISPFYDFYSFNVLPKLGEWVVNDGDSYKYLAESIRVHPDQKKLIEMLNSVGFVDAEYFNLSAGIVALHIGHKA